MVCGGFILGVDIESCVVRLKAVGPQANSLLSLPESERYPSLNCVLITIKLHLSPSARIDRKSKSHLAQSSSSKADVDWPMRCGG